LFVILWCALVGDVCGW